MRYQIIDNLIKKQESIKEELTNFNSYNSNNYNKIKSWMTKNNCSSNKEQI